MDNIRDFILPTETLNPENDEQTIAVRKPSAAEYSIVFASGPDFAVRRKTKAGSRVLVFLVSQSQYYIKDEKKETIEQFSPTLYARFMADAPDRIRLEEDSGTTCNWLTEIERGKVFGDALESVIRCFNTDEAARTAATHNWLLFSDLSYMSGRTVSANIAASEQIIKKVLTVCAEYNSEEAVKSSFTDLALRGYHASDKLGSALSALLGRFSWMNNRMLPGPRPACAADMIVDAYGLSGLEDILREYFQVGVQVFPSFAAFYELFHTCECKQSRYSMTPKPVSMEKRAFNLKDLKHYLWYQSVYQGYADDINNFMSSWSDSLRMQEIIYGKITEKYPEHLASCEKKLTYKYSKIKMQIDEEKWIAMVETMKVLEYKGKTYSIICPKTAADVLDEAQQQSNCVASYVGNIIRGECMIFFCRYTAVPDKSLVTVELRADGSLGQVKARFNHAPDADAAEFVEKWYEKVVLKSELWQQAA